MILFDRATTNAPRRTADGYLVADARVARTGIQQYLGSELGRPDLPIVNVYRPEDVVFSEDAIKSYAYRPITNNHPKEPVTAKTWKRDAVGGIGGDVLRDGEFVNVPLVLMDEAAITDYESGKRELSMGYDATFEFKDGFTPEGLPYQAIQTSMSMNHVALVDRARGGADLRIGDNSPAPSVSSGHKEGGQMADLKKMMVDGLTIETTEQGMQAIEKLQKLVGDSAAKLQAVTDAHSADIAKRDAEIDALKAKVLTDADIDARVTARADLIAKAKTVHDADYSGKSVDDIRKTAVVAVIGDAAIAGKAPAYVEARFDILVGDAATNADPMREHLKGKPTAPVQVSDHRAAFIAGLENAYKGAK